MAAPKEIVDLVERFESNLESYKSGHYNETQVRREFVDPFFKAMGWDIDNEKRFIDEEIEIVEGNRRSLWSPFSRQKRLLL